MTTEAQWVKTPEAASSLGISAQTLMRWRDCNGGFLAEGLDYQFGYHLNSPIRWNLEEVRKQIHHRGKLQRKALKIQKELSRA